MSKVRQMLQGLFSSDGMVNVFRRRFFRLVEALVFFLVIALLAVVAVQVFARFVIGASTPWTEELSQILLVWLVMTGAAAAMERKEHYVITVIVDRIPSTARLVMLGAANVLGALFLWVLVDIGWDYFNAGFRRSYIVTGIPHAITFLSLPIAAAMMLFSMITQSLETLVSGAVYRPHDEASESNVL